MVCVAKLQSREPARTALECSSDEELKPSVSLSSLFLMSGVNLSLSQGMAMGIPWMMQVDGDSWCPLLNASYFMSDCPLGQATTIVGSSGQPSSRTSVGHVEGSHSKQRAGPGQVSSLPPVVCSSTLTTRGIWEGLEHTGHGGLGRRASI